MNIENDDDSPSIMNKELSRMLLDLANYESPALVQHSLLLLDRYYSSESDIFQKALGIQLLRTPISIQFFNRVEKLLVELADYYRTGSDYVHNPESSPVQELTKSCWLEGEVEGYEPHQINQNIILSFGLSLMIIS